MKRKVFSIAIISFFSVQLSFARVTFEQIKKDVPDVFQRVSVLKDGKNADYIPALDEKHVDPNLFGVAVVKVDGSRFFYGNSKALFSIQSISKPFTYALALKELGVKPVVEKIGVNATGLPFNSMLSLELKTEDRRQNPMVNAGALQTVNLIPGQSKMDQWSKIHSFFNELAGGLLQVSETVFQSEMKTNAGNQSLALRLKKYEMIDRNLEDTLENYTKQCSLLVNAENLAVMGATLANWGVQPLSGKKLFDSEIAKNVLSVMVTSGLYDDSGQWFLDTGLPSKSGVGGAILSIVPGELAIVVFSPRLNRVGNSVRAEAVIRELSKRWKLHLLSKINSS